MAYFQTDKLAVGYKGKVLIHDIDINIEKGAILTLIGPNGAGKSTILKSITRHRAKLGGTVAIDGQDIHRWAPKQLARQLAVVLTERIRPELMTCGEVVATGRYPYTNALGKLTEKDRAVVRESLERVHALELEDQDFSTLSDGQRQRIMLARAICQEPEIIVLDEPTAYLDIRHLATKISDYLICVKGDTIAAFGPPEDILAGDAIDKLYDIEHGSYDLLFGSVELGKPAGEPEVFVVAGAGFGVDCFRALQKRRVPFAAGVLFENDVDCRIARELSSRVIAAPAFEPVGEEAYRDAAAALVKCRAVIDAGAPLGTFNAVNGRLLTLAKEKNIPVYIGWRAWAEKLEEQRHGA